MDDIEVPIYVHSTHVDIKASPEGYIGVKNGHINYVKRNFSVPKFEEKKFIGSEPYYHYDENTQVYRFPRFALSDLLYNFKKMREFGIPVKPRLVHIPCVLPRKINAEMQSWIKDRPGQTEVIEFLSQDKNMLACEAGTGFGKTTVSIKATILRKTVFLVICDGLVKQWVENIADKTTIPIEKIFVIKEAKSILNLIKNIKEGNLPDALVCSIQTVRNYIKQDIYPYNEIMTWEELLEQLGVETIIKDEYHLNFYAYLLVDLFSNVRTNIYLSATPRRNDFHEARLFNRIYPPNEILGGNRSNKKHLNIDLCAYNLELGVPGERFKTKYGYSQNYYENYLLRRKGYLNRYLEIIDMVINPEYFNKYMPGEARCLILCYTKHMCKLLRQYLSLKHSTYDIQNYLAGSSLDVLKADVIIGTIGGLGTGHDIPKLVTVLNTVSTKAETKLEQVPGRLRPVEGYQCKYIDIYNITIDSHKSHLYNKRRIYNRIAKEFNQLML